MILLQLFTLAFFAIAQLSAVPPLGDDVLSPKEKERIARAAKAEDRINVYEAASKRMQQAVQLSVTSGDFSTVPDALKTWLSLLSGSLEDIEANLKTKKKPKPLIHYEIQVRKFITDLQGYKTNAPVDQQEVFESCIVQAEKIHKRFVDMIFQH